MCDTSLVLPLEFRSFRRGELCTNAQVESHAAENRMSAVNLGVVIGPNVAWQRTLSPTSSSSPPSGDLAASAIASRSSETTLVAEMLALNSFVELLIRHHSQLFVSK